jgi:hypothetical protein
MGMVETILKSVTLPRMVRIRQQFDVCKIEDIPSAVIAELDRPEIKSTILAGKRICMTAGSRGVDNIALVLKTVASYLKEKGAVPFIIPAMGSHGGATAEGQMSILRDYGVTEEFCGCEVISCMDTVEIGKTPEGQSVFIDKYAAAADGIIVVGRIKPHTAFRGEYESGIMKMMAIGLGKQYGAEACHKDGFKKMAHMVPMFGNTIMRNCKVLFGIALIENSFDKTCIIKTLTPAEIVSEEPALLETAKKKMPSIKIGKGDILIVDQIGKNISGDGMDPNVSGTWGTPYASGGFQSERVVVLDLTDETHGNSNGLGMADVTTDRAFSKVVPDATYPNGLTSLILNVMKVPMHVRSDELAIKAAAKTCTDSDRDNLRIVRIKDTLHLGEIWISEALLEEAKQIPDIEILSEPAPFAFDEKGNLF